jgi:hypothetical protein
MNTGIELFLIIMNSGSEKERTWRHIICRSCAVWWYFWLVLNELKCMRLRSIQTTVNTYRFMHYTACDRSRDSVVSIESRYGLDDWEVAVPVPAGSRNFTSPSLPVLGSTQPPIQWVPWAFSPGIKRQGREADHSPAASAEVLTRLHGVVFNYLSTGTNLPLPHMIS